MPEPKLDTRKERERRGERDRERPETHSYRIVFTRHRKTDTEDTHENSTGLLPPPLDSLSLSRAPPTRHYLYKRGRYNGEPLAPPPTVPRDISCCACVFSLLTYSSLTPYSHATHTKKSICAHTRRRHAIGILHPPPAHAATSKGNEEGHTKRGSTARPCKGRRSRTEAHTLHPLLPRAFPLSARASDAVRSRPRRLRGALVAPIRVEALL